MNLFELFVKIDANTDGVEKGIKQAQKTTEQYRKDVMNLAQTYKKQGMDMSSAMKRAYSEIDKSQYQTANNSKSDSKKFALNWENAGNKISGIASKIGSGLKVAAKIGTAAIGVAAAGITALTTTAVKNYAEYEQLVGGVDTLFKSASKKVQGYAAEAYKTAGMSANDYMESATAFSATLINSLGGDTEKAAEYANRAMISMSDNANKMGNSMESIVLTYQSLSRGNFAMLDNLKLGYGGTKAELQRLIKDASTYTDVQKEMGITVDASSMSFDNIVNAIAVVQGKLGIAGATSQEAATTISGSLISMKAAWTNLVTGIADENADFNGLINNMVESVSTFAENILPRIEQALSGIGALIEGLAPKISEKLPELISTVLPNLVLGLETLLTSAVAVLPSLLDTVLNTAVPSMLSGFETIWSVLLANLPSVIETLASGLQTALPLLIEAVISVVGKIAEALPETISTLTEVLPELFSAISEALLTDGLPALVEIAVELIKGLAQAFPDIASALTEILPDFYSALIPAVIESIPILIAALPSILAELFQALPSILLIGFLAGNPLGLLFSAIYSILRDNWEGIKTFFSETIPQIVADIVAWFESLPEKIGFIIGSVIKFFMDLPENIRTWLSEAIQKIKDWISNMKSTVQEKVPEIIDKIKGFFEDLPDKIKQVGKDIVNGLWNGINGGWTWLKNKVNNLVNGLVSGVKKGLGIASPSKVFKRLGKWTAEGYGIGFEDEFANVKDDIEGDFSNLITDTDYGITTSSTSVSDFGGGSSVYGRGVSQSVNVTVGIDDSANAMGLARALLPFLKIAEKEVYA